MARRTKPTLAIIGAGISGLVAARLCQKAGLAVTLYDKGRGVGGRCATRRRDDFAFDHGVQLIGASDGQFRSAVRNWMVSTTAQKWRGSFLNLPKSVTPFVGVPSMSAISKLLARDLNIYLPVEVSEVRAAAGGQWSVVDSENRVLGDYDAVVLTCPPKQAKNLVGEVWGLEAAFNRPVRMRAVWTVLAAFRGPVDTPYDGALLDGEPLDWVARNSSKPERDKSLETWVIQAGPDITEQFLDHPKEEVIGDLTAAFEHWLETPLPPIMFSQAQRWLYGLAEGEPATEKSVFNEDMAIGLAGDWLNPPQDRFHGVQSAWQSGKDIAARIKTWAKNR